MSGLAASDWLSQLPATWEAIKLKYLVDFAGGATPDRSNASYWNGKIPWVSPKDMKLPFITDTEDHITEEGLRNSATRLIEPDAVLIVVRSGILQHTIPVAINRVPVSLNQDMRALTSRGRIIAPYLHWLITGCQDALLTLWRKEGATVESLEYEFMSQTKIPLPLEKDQNRIINFLDAKLGRLDELMRKKERQLLLLAEKRQALISHAVTRGLNSNAPTRPSGIEWLGNIPAHWDVKRLKYVAASVQTGSTPPTNETRLFSEDGVKWFTPGDFSPDGRLADSARYVSEDAVLEGFVERFHAPVILIVSIGATLGKIGLSEHDCCCNQQINAVRIRKPNSPFYFCHLLTVLSKFMIASSNQATLPIFNQTQARNLPVLAPPPEEQIAIVAWLDERLTRMERTADVVTRQLTKLREYRQSLIAAAVTGQIEILEVES